MLNFVAIAGAQSSYDFFCCLAADKANRAIAKCCHRPGGMIAHNFVCGSVDRIHAVFLVSKTIGAEAPKAAIDFMHLGTFGDTNRVAGAIGNFTDRNRASIWFDGCEKNPVMALAGNRRIGSPRTGYAAVIGFSLVRFVRGRTRENTDVQLGSG